MAVQVTQPLSNVIPVTDYFIAPGGVPLPFNQGIVIGNSSVINSVTQRVLAFSNLAAVTTAGFTNTDPEYIAAQLYFGQTPQPLQLWIGRQDLTAIQTVTISTTPATAITIGGDAGTSYVVGNTFSINGLTGSIGQVTSVGGSGAVTGVALLAGGQSATVANNIATTNITGVGTGLNIDVTAVGSTGGTGFAVNDVVYVNQSGGSGGYLTVATISTGGVVTGLSTIPWQGQMNTGQGTGYSVGYGIPVVPVTGVGTGLDINITVVGETPLQAVQACRLATPLWYIATFFGSHQDGTPTSQADQEAIAGYIEGAYPSSQYFYTASDQATLNGSQTSFPGYCQVNNFKRSNGTYSTVQGPYTTSSITVNDTSITVTSASALYLLNQLLGTGEALFCVGYGIPIGTTVVSITGTTVVLSNAATVTDASVGLAFGPYPNNVFSCAAVMGLMMGLNATQGPGSYFSGTYKQTAGVAFEPLTETQLQNVCGTASRTTKGLGCNVVTAYDFGAYTGQWIYATQASGNFFDEILQLDMLVNNIQNTVFSYFASALSIPITNNGTTVILNLIAQCCNNSLSIGFLASGVWLGQTIGTGPSQISPGESFPNGYEIYIPSVSTLSLAQLAERQMPVASVALIEARSGIYQPITLYVQ
jgi:hypothetical protein